MRQLVLVVAAAAALAACSKSDSPSGPPPPGCDHATLSGTCTARAGLTAADCSGTFRPEGCPQTGAVGTCIDAQGQMTVFYAPNFDAYFAHILFCDDGQGAWIGTGAPQVQAACDATGLAGPCMDLSGPQDEVDGFLSLCTNAGAAAGAGPCPTAGRTGTCSTTSGSIAFDGRYYDTATVADDAAACSGTWTPN